MPAYSTAVYPYPEAMWDEAYEHLQTHRGWSTILLVCPDIAAATEAAEQAMRDRGMEWPTALIVRDAFSTAYTLRIARLVHIDPRWDDVEDHLANHASAALLAFDTETYDAGTVTDEARAAMAERGLNVSVGLALDSSSRMAVLRITKVG